MRSKDKLLLIPLLLLLSNSVDYLSQVDGAKILTVAFVSSKSHKIFYEPLLQELAKRGHEVTAVGAVVSKNETNFRNIQTLDAEELFKDRSSVFELKLKLPGIFEALQSPYIFVGYRFADLCQRSFELPQVQAIFKEKFDLIMFTPLFNECLYGLVHTMNTTTILYQQQAVFPWVSDTLGTPTPTSFVTANVGASDQLSFGQRTWNLIKSVMDWGVMEFYYYPLVEKVYRKHFNNPNLPSVREIEKNASLVLTNSHISYSRPRPLLPDIIEVGGLHLKPSKPVPKELDDFLSGAKDGFIYFSMGSTLKGSLMPERYRVLFLNVFAKLKQRVLWKWETEQMEGLPANVKLSKWLPQQDVLGHKNIRLFISHGGLGSTTESIYHAVPLVGIPMFGDQPMNMRKAAAYGFAHPPLDFVTLSEDSLLNAINTVLNNKSYQETAKRLSRIFLDQPTKPLDRAVYWIEYVLRHKGATHLRSAARDLNYIQYFSLDVLAVLGVIALVLLKINILIAKVVFRKCFGAKTPAKAAAESKKKR